MKKLVTLLAVALVATAANALVIDNFTDSSIAGITAGSTTSPIVDSGLNGVLGGTRTMEYYTDATPFDIGGGVMLCPSNVGFSTTYEDGAVTLNNGFNYGALTLSYSGFSVDLTTGTKLSIDMDPDHVAYGTKHAVFSFTVTDGSNSATVTKDTWDASYLSGGANYNPDRFELDFMLSEFSGVDLTNVTGIQAYIETDVAGDYAVFGLTTDAIPEPATIAILGIGAILLRKKRRA